MMPITSYMHADYCEETIPESLAMMVSFLLRRLRRERQSREDAEKECKRLQSDATAARNELDGANKELQRLTKELLELRGASQKKTKRVRSNRTDSR